LAFRQALREQKYVGDPVKVRICHFEGHEYGSVFYTSTVTGEELDGDYVFTYKGEAAVVNQTMFCEGWGGEVLLVSVHAVENDMRGHRVQNLDRGIGSYPDGYKG